MGNTSEVSVEIPPPEVSPGEPSRWGIIVVSVAMVAAVVVFVLVTSPRIPPIDWQRVTGPSPVNLDSVVATAEGFAMLSGMTVDGVLLWWSDHGVEWRSRPLREARTQLTELDRGLFAYGDIEGHLLLPAEGEWVESEEELILPDEVRSRQGSGRPSVIDTHPGMLAMSILGDVWWSSDNEEFDRVISEPEWGAGAEVGTLFDSVCRPPSRTSPDVPPMVTTDDGMFALVSSNQTEPFGIWPVCEPRVWVSADGSEWAATDPIIADGAYVYDLAWRDGRFVAVGGYGLGEPAVWTSTDGADWEMLQSFPGRDGIDLYTVAAGPAAWVILGQTDEQSSRVGWISLDGICWESLPLEVSGSDAVVGTESLLVLDRTSYPELWHGSVTGGTGSC